MTLTSQSRLQTIIKENDYPYIGAKLRDARYEAGYTLVDISKILGVTRMQVINYEKGNQLTTWMLLALSQFYNKPVSYFLPEQYQ